VVSSHLDTAALLRARLRLALHSSGGKTKTKVVHHERGRYYYPALRPIPPVNSGCEVRGRLLAPDAYVRARKDTEPVALLSAVSTDRPSWALRPSAYDLWMRHQPTRAPYSVRLAIYVSRDRRTRSEAAQNAAMSAKFYTGGHVYFRDVSGTEDG